MCFQAGMPIRLFHKDAEAYLCAEGLGGYDLTQDGRRHDTFPDTASIVDPVSVLFLMFFHCSSFSSQTYGL